MSRGGKRSRSGPAPKPSALKVLTGGESAKRISADEPKPEMGDLTPPDHLRGQALDTWEELAPVLQRMRIFTEADRVALSGLCDAVRDYYEARVEVILHGRLIEGPGGRLSANPAVAQSSDAWKRMFSGLTEFGLTPSSRTRVRVEKTGDVDPLEELKRRRRAAKSG